MYSNELRTVLELLRLVTLVKRAAEAGGDGAPPSSPDDAGGATEPRATSERLDGDDGNGGMVSILGKPHARAGTPGRRTHIDEARRREHDTS